MLWDASAIRGYSVHGGDGWLGTVFDALFSDDIWRVRWLVVNTGKWLSDRNVLIHPSALGQPDPAKRQFPVELTKSQIKTSPDISADQPVSRQMESRLYDHYGWDSAWGDGYFGTGPLAMGLGTQPYMLSSRSRRRVNHDARPNDGDPHLRSIEAITGYHVHATDGAIGHVKDLLVDDVSWGIRYILIDTRNWWPGEKVLIAPCSVRDIEWTGKLVALDVTREQVKGSPRYDPSKTTDRAYDEQLHAYYGWPGYGL